MNPIYIIAEIAQGAEGSTERIKELVKAAFESGANAIKFQVYQTDELVEASHPEYSLFKKWEFSADQWKQTIQSIPTGLDVWCDVFGEASFKIASGLNIKGIKIHSSDINNYPLLKLAASYPGKIMLGVGGSHLIEIFRALTVLSKATSQKRVVLMPGIQVFPTKLESNNLNVIPDLISRFNLPVGFADHLDGNDEFAITLPSLAISKGASIIEKHLTISRKDKWEDYQSALEPAEFKKMVAFSGFANLLQNTPVTYVQTEDEKKYRKYSKKIMLAKNNLAIGSKITPGDIIYKRPAEADSGTANYNDVINNEVVTDKFAQGKPILNSAIRQKVGLLLIARLASTRLKDKALLPLGDLTTLEFLINRLKLSAYGANITLCTTTNKEDDALVELAKKNNISFVRGSEKNILQRLIKAIDEFGYNHIVRVTGDDLLRDIEAMDEGIRQHLDKNVDYTWMDGLPYGVDSETFSSRFIKEIAVLAEEPDNTEYLTWFTYDPNINSIHKLSYPFPEHYRLTLDTVDDYEVFKKLSDAFNGKLISAGTKEIVDFLDKNPAVVKINSGVQPKLDKSKINTRMDFSKGLYEKN